MNSSQKITAVISIILTTILLAGDVIYWDLGVAIKPKQQTASDSLLYQLEDGTYIQIGQLRSNIELIPEKVKIDFKANSSKIEYKVSKNLLHSKNTEAMNVDVNYRQRAIAQYLLERFTAAVRNFDKIDFNKMESSELIRLKFLYADALYRSGNYLRAYKMIKGMPDSQFNDEIFFLLGLVCKELGDEKGQKEAIFHLINNFPESDYQLISKLQYRSLNR